MSENTGNKKNKSASRPPSSGKKPGSGNKHKHSAGSSGKKGSRVNLNKKSRLAGRTVEMSSGQQISIEEVMNEPEENMEQSAPKPNRHKPAPPINDEDAAAPVSYDENSGNLNEFKEDSLSNEINWRKQIKSIVIWTFSVILLSLTFFPGESLWYIIHSFILGVLGFKAFLWAGLMVFFGYLMTKQVDDVEMLDVIRPVAGIILLIDVLSYILIQSDGYRNVYNEFSFTIWQLFNQMLKDGTKVGGSGLLSGAIGELFILFAGKAGAAIIVSILLTALIMVLTHTGPIDLFNQGKRLIKTLLDPDFYKKLFEVETEQTAYKTVFDSDEPFDDYDPEYESDIDVEVPPEEIPEDQDDDFGFKTEGDVDGGEDESSGETAKTVSAKKKKKLSKAEEIKAQSDEITKQIESGDPSPDETAAKEYKFPPLRLLTTPRNVNSSEISEELTETSEKLINTLEEYSVKATIVGISPGPTVTRYEVMPAPGVKISKINNLSKDIALRLAAPSIRIEAPIPGKSAVGIEIPKKNKQIVRIKELLGSREFMEDKGALTVALGKDIEGKIVLCELSKMPHLLIAGSTGSGKSVCVNSMLMSLLYKYSPDEVRMVLIDPKSVEFDMYNGIPHLLVPVVCEPKKAAGALQWAVSEMLKRYEMLKQRSVRNIDGYNRLAEKTGEFEKLCRIVIVIDEMADLMIASPKEVEDAIFRLAAMARAAGMHMVLATQRPSVDVITGTIKSNIPSRIAFAVSSQVDSRTILDEGGAENLIGYGDMLYHPMGSNMHIRVQGCFVEDAEVDRVIRFVKQNGLAEYDDNIADEIERISLDNSGDNADDFEGKDSLFDSAVEIVTELGQASTSMLQRRLSIGYSRAGRIIDQLERHGIIGPSEGSKPRAVLITRMQWMEMTMSRSHSGKNDPIVRSHSEFAAQTLEAGHEEITARQSEFFNIDSDDDLYDEEEFLEDSSEMTDTAASESTDIPEADDSQPENKAEAIVVDEQSSGDTSDGEPLQEANEVTDVEIEENAQDKDEPVSDPIPQVTDLTRFIAHGKSTARQEPEESVKTDSPIRENSKKAKPTAGRKGKKNSAAPPVPPRDFSIFFEDDQDEVDDFFIFSRNESVNAEDHTPESNPAAVESQDIPPWEEYPAEKPSSSAEVVQPVPHATDRNSEETQNQNSVQTTDQTADKSDDDDFFDDVMSSPWIKKL